MKFSKKVFLILLLPLFAFTVVHKFYLSVTNITYSEKDDSLQITSRVFIDDLQELLKERYGINGNLDADIKSAIADEYLEEYIRAKFTIGINGKPKSFDFYGKKYDADAIIFYLEVSKVDLPSIRNIQVQNKVLTDLYDEQKNIVHFKIKDKKKSFVFTKLDAKGMLKL